MELLFKRVKRGLREQRKGFIFSACTILISLCVFVAFMQSGYNIENSFAEFGEKCATSQYTITGSFDNEQLQVISQLDDVDIVSAKLTTSAELKKGDAYFDVTLDVYANEPELDKYLITDGSTPNLNGAVVSYGFAKYNDIEIGDVVSIEDITGRKETVTVNGFYIAASEVYAATINELNGKQGRVKLVGEANVFNSLSINLKDSASEEDFYKTFDELGFDGYTISLTNDSESFTALRNTTNDYIIIGTFVGVIVLLIGIVLVTFFVSRLILAQNKSIAILKSMAYPNSKIIAYYVLITACFSVIAALMGVGAGSLVALWIQNRVLNSLMIDGVYRVCLPAILSAPIAVVFVSVLAFFVSLKIIKHPVSQIFCITAVKRGRRVFIERLAFFWDRLSSHTQNSIRMMARHRVRSTMSIIGTALGLTLCIAVLAINYFNSAFSKTALHDTFGFRLRAYANSTESYNALLETVSDCIAITDYSIVYDVQCSISDGENTYSGSCLVMDVDSGNYNIVSETGDLISILGEDGVVINKSIADYISATLGQPILFENSIGLSKTVPLSSICEQYYGAGVFINRSVYTSMFGELQEIPELLISTTDAASVLSKLQDVPGVRCIDVVAEFDIIQNNNAASAFTFFAIAGMGIVFALILFVSMANVTIVEREREIVIMKSLGISNFTIINSFLKEWFLFATVGLLISIPLAKKLIHLLVELTIRDHTLLSPLFIPKSSLIIATTVLFLSVLMSTILLYQRLNRLKIADLER